ncbi:MAG TPA: stalk domain-containing protein, partial [Pseudobacillus sp.]
IVKDNRQLNGLTEAFIKEEVLRDYRFKEGEEWFTYLIVSYKLGRPTGPEKLKTMYNRLNEQLTAEERNEWKQLLFRLTKEPITAEQLDRTLSTVKGLDTDFFAENKNENRLFHPLFFYEDRSILVNGNATKIQAVNQDGQLFFPFSETLQSLGYEVKKLTDGKSLLVRREYNTYRFYPDQNRFILNEEKYGLYENALQIYEGRLYLSQKWLQKIFLVTVQSERNINVQDLEL